MERKRAKGRSENASNPVTSSDDSTATNSDGGPVVSHLRLAWGQLVYEIHNDPPPSQPGFAARTPLLLLQDLVGLRRDEPLLTHKCANGCSHILTYTCSHFDVYPWVVQYMVVVIMVVRAVGW